MTAADWTACLTCDHLGTLHSLAGPCHAGDWGRPCDCGAFVVAGVVERLDGYTDEEHRAKIEAARERVASRQEARSERARKAAARLRGDVQ